VKANSDAARLARAFLVAPLAAPAACTVALVGGDFLQGIFGGPSSHSLRAALGLAAGIFAVGIPLAYAATLVAAVACLFIFRTRGSLSRPVLWALGAVVGCATALVISPILRGELFSIPFPWWAGALLGLCSAETLWRLLPRAYRSQSPLRES
jgi:hypothetical protein